jgi:hypothetical protein
LKKHLEHKLNFLEFDHRSEPPKKWVFELDLDGKLRVQKISKNQIIANPKKSDKSKPKKNPINPIFFFGCLISKFN